MTGRGQLVSWKEGHRITLENRLDDIIAGVVAAAKGYREIVAEWHQTEQTKHAAALHRAEFERQRAVEAATKAALVAELERQARAWTLARMIREYAVAAVCRVDETGDRSKIPISIAPSGMSHREWLTWAEAYADQIDPLVPKRHVCQL